MTSQSLNRHPNISHPLLSRRRSRDQSTPSLGVSSSLINEERESVLSVGLLEVGAEVLGSVVARGFLILTRRDDDCSSRLEAACDERLESRLD